MEWVFIFTIIFYVLANLTNIYAAIFVHKKYLFTKIWGYAPQQLLWLIVIYPFALFCTLTSLYIIKNKIAPLLNPNLFIAKILTNWTIIVLTGFIFTGIFTCIVYFFSALNIDKLKPVYVKRSLDSLEHLEEEIENIEEEKRNEYRKQKIKNARDIIKNVKLPSEAEIDIWLNKLPQEQYLRVIQDRVLQRKLKLIHPTINFFNVIQHFLGFFTAFLCGISILICIEASKSLGPDLLKYPQLSLSIRAVYYAVIFFAFHTIFYQMYRARMESYIGTGFTVFQDILSYILIIYFLIRIILLDLSNVDFSILNIFSMGAVAVIGAYPVLIKLIPKRINQIFGSETKPGIQLMFILFFLIFATLASVRIWI